jgi:recombination protein RecR
MDAFSRLIDALRCLPGIGPKSAQRMTYSLLQHQRQRGFYLATCLEAAMRDIRHCELCNNYTENNQCSLCQNLTRDKSIVCVVETPADIAAIEQSNAYIGTYYVLMGKISPLDGIGPNDIALDGLHQLIKQGQIREVILALSPTIEGQTTIHFIQTLLSPYPLKMSQLAHGIPAGGELEFLDAHTIGSALRNRGAIDALDSR